MGKPLREQVIVVTGASSGIGLATATAAAAKGARVVLVARNEADLARICAGIAERGGRATYAVADVGDSAAVRRAAAHAVEAFGGFDTWVNVAGLTIYGALKDVAEADNVRLMQTNLFGTVHGSLVAAEHLRTRGGTIINVGSVASDLAFPMQGMYVASKHAVKGFTDALRMELLQEGAPIAVTLLKPNSIDSPLPQRARNYMEKEPMLPPPVYRPHEVANAVLSCAVHPRRELVVGGGGAVLIAFRRLLPSLYDRLAPAITTFERRSIPARNPEGALHAPQDGGRERGAQPGPVQLTSLYTRAVLRPGAALAAASALGGLLALAAMSRRGRRGSADASLAGTGLTGKRHG